MPNRDDSRPPTPPQSATGTGTGTATPTTVSSSVQNVQKADQIAHRFFIKFLLILAASRSTALEHGPRSSKVDKWFNLETPDTDIHRDHMRAFRSISSMSPLPTLTLHTVLVIPDLGTNRALVAVDALDHRMRIEPTPRAVLLETWTLTTSPQSSSGSFSSGSLSSSESGEVSLAAVYKHAISLFRSLYTLCRQLPAAKLFQRYRQRTGVALAPQAFSIELRLQLDSTVLTFDAPPSPSRPVPLPTSTHGFPALATPLGALKIAVRYLSRPNFRIDTIESLISSKLFTQDAAYAMEESVAFTPTVVAHRARDSAASSPGSGGVAIRSTRVPPSASTPRHTRTTSFPAVTGAQSQRIPQEGAGASISDYDAAHTGRLLPSAGSPRYANFRPEALAFATSSSLGRTPGTPTRVGREALESTRSGSSDRNSPGTSASPPSALSRIQQGTSPRIIPSETSRPSLPSIPAFRSSTLAPSGLNSPSTSLRSIGMGTPGLSKPPSSLPHAIPETQGQSSSRAWPALSSSPQSAGVMFPSNEPPPFASPSTSAPRSGAPSLGALLSGTPRTGEPPGSGGIVTKTPGKRYSSSFGHRRAPSTGGTNAGNATPGSAGASATGERRYSSGRPGASPAAGLAGLPTDNSRPVSTLLDPTENEENLSEFIREIDNARLRSNGTRTSESRSSSSVSSSGVGVGGPGHARRASQAERRQSPLVGRLDLPAPASPRSPPPRLQELNLMDQEPERRESPPEDPGVVGSGNTTGRIGMQISNNPQALGMQLQSMDDAFKKSLQGLKDRRRIGARPAESSSLSEERQPSTSGADADDMSRRSGPSFRSGGIRDRNATETDPIAANANAPTPGDSTASDGSGYAGIVGRLDFDSSESQTQALPTELGASQPFVRAQAQPSDVRYHSTSRATTSLGLPHSTPPGSPSLARTNVQDQERGRDEDPEGRYEGDSEGAARRPDRVTRYVSVLRRDGTLRVNDPSRMSSGSTAPSDSSSAARRPAPGRSGGS